MAVQALVAEAQGTVAGDGTVTVDFNPVPASLTWTGTISIPGSSVSGVWTVLVGGLDSQRPRGAWVGPGPWGPVQAQDGLRVQLRGTGLTPGNKLEAVWVGRSEPSDEAVPDFPAASPNSFANAVSAAPELLVFTALGASTFTKANHPGLVAVRYRLVAGGGGGGAESNAGEGAGGGGGGGYAEGIVPVGDLDDDEIVTVGGGGTRGEFGGSGSSGGASSFGSHGAATGGDGGNNNGAGGAPGVGTAGDFQTAGQGGAAGGQNDFAQGAGGSSPLGGGARGAQGTAAGDNGPGYGGGGAGGSRVTAGNANGGGGRGGVVMLELSM